jgi:uncharacterized protein (DUF608 family)
VLDALGREDYTQAKTPDSFMSERTSSTTNGRRQTDLDRRRFLKLAGLAAAGLAFSRLPAMAGPFTRPDFDGLVPADKKLRPEWVKSLTDRGEPTVYRGADLEKIGMPVGGLCAGQLYLGGDGKLWHWDIFNAQIGTGAEHYANPLAPSSPLNQGFALRVKTAANAKIRRMDRANWSDVSFIGEYPIGRVEYQDADSPVSVSLEAFSPFIPLNTDDSSLPATVMEFTVTNRGAEQIDVELAGWLENAVCLRSSQSRDGRRRNRIVRGDGTIFLECEAEDVPAAPASDRPDIDLQDFEGETYGDWVATGTAFGSGPIDIGKIPAYQGDVKGHGRRVANSHATAPGGSVGEKDAATGTLTSPPFAISRNFINFLVGGGSQSGKTCVNLLVDGKAALTATGRNSNEMRPASWDVRPWTGKMARIEIVDAATGGWGNIGADFFVLSDRPSQPQGPLTGESDFGGLCLALLDSQNEDFGRAALLDGDIVAGVFARSDTAPEIAERPFRQKLVGALCRKATLAPSAAAKIAFVVAWHFPNLRMNPLPPGRHYATRFASAPAVAAYVAKNFARLAGQTRLWRDTWRDGTLPHWFLERTFLNASILATSTCHRLGNGRFYAREGVGCCEGTCGHVWQYAHSMARLFPDLERRTREEVDFGLALQPDGAIHFRCEFNDIPAIDAQAGTILRALREHQMSADAAFLQRNWPAIRRATEWLIAKDGNADGLIESNQHNTLDTDWFGPVAWLSGLYLAALLAAAAMADETGDAPFATKCREIAQAGRENMLKQLFDDGYFINKADSKHLDAINSGTGCEIDQVFGQSWAFQVGLPRVLPEKETVSALRSLWRYNFTPDAGPYRKAYKPGRWYAMAGEAGLLMCSFPRTDWDYTQAKGQGPDWAAGYFNECMTGFEYQVAGHMIWEGLLTEGLAVTRAIHDRYHASRRNPWNEVECGDHYARAMASHGVFLAACGFECHGPKGHIGFAPRLSPENFQSAFTAPEGWGSYQQKITGDSMNAEFSLRWGSLRLRSMALAPPPKSRAKSVRVVANDRAIEANFANSANRALISFAALQEITAGQKVEIGMDCEPG